MRNGQPVETSGPGDPPPRSERVAGPLVAYATATREEILASWHTTPAGLTTAEAGRRLAADGPNEIASRGIARWPVRLARTCWNPLVILLGVLAASSLATGDLRAGTVIAAMIVLGVGLRFVQEARADAAAAKLRAMISVHPTVVRDGQPREMPLASWCPATWSSSPPGDMIPADVRLIVGQGPVRDPGQPDRRVVSGREVRGREDPAAARRSN